MVLKDSHGTVVDYKLRRINGLCQPKEAEAISVNVDLARLQERQVNKVVVETDSISARCATSSSR